MDQAKTIQRNWIIQKMRKMVSDIPLEFWWYYPSDPDRYWSIFYLAEEIENLRKEAQALKAIRESMGSQDFAQKVFDKVFQDDIIRLRDMEDIWKTRKPPEPLSFSPLHEEAIAVESTISSDEQKIWSVVEDFAVFKDRYCNISGNFDYLT